MLEVVDHQQQVLGGQEAFDRLVRGLAREHDDPERLDDRRGNVVGPLQGERARRSARRRRSPARLRGRPPARVASCRPRPEPVSVSSRTEAAPKPFADRVEIVLAADRAVGRQRQPALAVRAGRCRRRLGARASSAWRRTSSCSSRSGCPGSMPSSSTNRVRERHGRPSSASACRPQRYSASICSSTRRSLKGCAMTSASSWPSSSPWRPSSRSSSIPSIVAARRSSSSRARSPSSNPCALAPPSGAPRQTPSASSMPIRAVCELDRPRVPAARGRAPLPSGRHRARQDPPPGHSRRPD